MSKATLKGCKIENVDNIDSLDYGHSNWKVDEKIKGSMKKEADLLMNDKAMLVNKVVKVEMEGPEEGINLKVLKIKDTNNVSQESGVAWNKGEINVTMEKGRVWQK